MADDDTPVSEVKDGYYKTEILTFNQILMLQVKKICTLGSQDLVGGYSTEKNRVIGNLVVSESEYITSVRDAYCNAVLMLNALAKHRYIPKYSTTITDIERINAEKMELFYNEWDKKIKLDFEKNKKEGGTQETWYKIKIEAFIKLFEELCSFLNVSDVTTVGG